MPAALSANTRLNCGGRQAVEVLQRERRAGDVAEQRGVGERDRQRVPERTPGRGPGRANARPVARSPPRCRRCGGRVSGITRASGHGQHQADRRPAARTSAASSRSRPAARRRAPAPAIGATLDSVMNSENSRAAATPLVRSAATARASTIPPPPEAPCTNRHTVSQPDRRRERAQHATPPRRRGSSRSSSRRRPRASDSGPEHELPDDEPDHVGGQGELHGGLARAEIVGELRERRQVQVHRQRAEGGEAAEQHGEARARRRPAEGGGRRSRIECRRLRIDLSNTCFEHRSIEESDGSASARVLRRGRRGAELHPGRGALPRGAVGAQLPDRPAGTRARRRAVRAHQPLGPPRPGRRAAAAPRARRLLAELAAAGPSSAALAGRGHRPAAARA